MSMSKMTIVRALTQIKLLQKKFDKECAGLELVSIKLGQKLKRPFNSESEEDFVKKAVSQYDSINSIMSRITVIKTAIDKSNSTTIVKIGGKDMTVQEALVEKKYVLLKKQLLRKLQEIKKDSLDSLSESEENIQERCDKYREELCGGGNKDNKKNDDIEDSVKAFSEAFKVSLVDPCQIDTKIKELDDWIEVFLSNVDFVLSESNTRTEIEIPD